MRETLITAQATELDLADHTAVPDAVRLALAPQTDPQAAEVATRRLATTHYENFSVISALLPRHLRQDFCNVYAFCRVADDLGDELNDREESLRLLGEFARQTRDMYQGRTQTVVFTALSGTVRRHNIPIEPFLDLIDAFEQDQRVLRYETFDQVVDYCRRSANPVGRLVLYMCGYRDEQRQRLSDQTCTALQLTNFWQDVRRDLLDRDRIYLPKDSMERFGVSEAQIREGRFDENFKSLLRHEIERTEPMFDQGERLLRLLDGPVRRQVALFGEGGRAILRAIVRQGYDTLSRRPALSAWQKGRLILRAGASILSPGAWTRGGGVRA